MPMKLLTKPQTKNTHLRVAFPHQDYPVGQDSEWCVVQDGTGWNEFRFHDYGKIFEIPGLYEKIFLEHLSCRSHEIVAEALAQSLKELDLDLTQRKILDLGAGNGHVGAKLRTLGARYLIGVDALKEAHQAAHRDHPQLYRDYLITRPNLCQDIQTHSIDTVVCVAALGFGDVGPELFEEIVGMLKPGNVLAFNIKEQFLNSLDPTGFNQLFLKLQSEGILKPLKQWRHFHRYSTWGEALYYSGVVAQVL